jgi:hypothetical protein
LKTDYGDVDDEKGKLRPPMPLMSEAKSPSSQKTVKCSTGTVQESPPVPTLQTPPAPFADQHETPSVPTAERLFQNTSSSAHNRPTPAASATDPQTTFTHHADSSDDSVSPVSPITPGAWPNLLVSPASPVSATQYASPYEQWQIAELGAEYERFENPRGPRWSVPAHLASGRGGGTAGLTAMLAWRGGLQAGERLSGERGGTLAGLAVESRHREFIWLTN